MSWRWLGVYALTLLGCAPRIALENRPCPCAEGWTCCEVIGVCVPRGQSCLGAPLPAGAWYDAVEWQDPAPGRWVTIDVGSKGVKPDGSDVTAALQALIDGVSEPTILTLGPGTYRVGTLSLRSQVILRGAGEQTTLALVGTSAAVRCRGRGGPWDWDVAGPLSARPLTTDVPAGGRQLRVASGDGISRGDVVAVAGALERPAFPSGKWSLGGTFLVSDVAGNELTLDRPLRQGLRAKSAQGVATLLGRLEVTHSAGVEALRIVPAAGSDPTISISICSNVFLRNLVLVDAPKRHLEVQLSRQIVVENSLLESTQRAAGITVEILSTGIRATNNTLRQLYPALEIYGGSSDTIYSYNLHQDLVRDACLQKAPAGCASDSWVSNKTANGLAAASHIVDVALHGHAAHSNLLEGNVLYVVAFDYEQYTMGPANTTYRNRLLGQPKAYPVFEGQGYGVIGPSDHQVLVGNELRHGATISVGPSSDGRAAQGLLIGGNQTTTLDWGALTPDTRLPASLYLREQPTWWPKNLAWPPFGPGGGGEGAKIPAQQR